VFNRLYYILLTASALIFLFFIASSSAFSARLSPSFPAQTWQTRWLLLDGWLSLIFAATFFAVAFLWRPTGSNRGLALHDELPGSENEADLYDVDALLPDADREDAGELGSEAYSLRRMSRDRGRDETVFEVGSEDEDEESEDDEHGRKGRRNGERGEEHEHRGLIGGDDDFDITKQCVSLISFLSILFSLLSASSFFPISRHLPLPPLSSHLLIHLLTQTRSGAAKRWSRRTSRVPVDVQGRLISTNLS
jgi:hypothetical protein